MKIALPALLMLCLNQFNAHAETSFSTENTQVATVDGEKLNAVLTIPKEKITATALIIQGSGNVAADGDVSGPFLGKGYQGQPAKLSEQIAETLASVGVATIRYSKRGVDNPSQKLNQKFPYLLSDANAALKLLAQKFPGVKTSIVGFSEGALIASLLSVQTKVDGLFLLAPALRPVDEWFSYQFVAWPVELLKKNVKADAAGMMTSDSLSEKSIALLPAMGQPWSVLDFNHDQKLSLTEEVIPGYQGFYAQVRGLLGTPDFAGWYESLKALPEFQKYASAISAPVIQIYQGMDDSQMRWSWIVEDLNFFPVKPSLHLFPGLGHCFSPMEGAIGEVKTSGPYDSKLLEQLKADFSQL